MDIAVVVFIVSSLVLLLYAERMMGVFYGKRRTSLPIMVLMYGVVLVMIIIQFFIFRHRSMAYWAISEFVSYSLGFFIITFNYKSSIAKRFAVVVSTYLTLTLVSLLVGGFIGYFFNIYHIDEVFNDDTLILTGLFLPPAAYLVAALLRGFRNIKRSKASSFMAIIIPISVFLVLTLIVLLPPALGFSDSEILFEYTLIIQVIFLVGFVFLIFFLTDTLTAKYEEKLKSERQAQEKEYYFAQCQLMQESAKQVRAVQHDMKNHLATIKTYTAGGSYGDVESYLDSLMDSIEKSETYSDTGNIAFDSIINYKLRNAKSDNIQLDLSVAVPPEINVEVVDIVTILGNLLDNALEAVAKASEKFIKLDIEFGKGGLFTKVENSFNGEINYATGDDENEKRIASLKSGEAHGYGLKNIQQSVEKYDGYMKISHTKDIFSSTVFLYVYDK